MTRPTLDFGSFISRFDRLSDRHSVVTELVEMVTEPVEATKGHAEAVAEPVEATKGHAKAVAEPVEVTEGACRSDQSIKPTIFIIWI